MDGNCYFLCCCCWKSCLDFPSFRVVGDVDDASCLFGLHNRLNQVPVFHLRRGVSTNGDRGGKDLCDCPSYWRKKTNRT